MEKVLYFLGPQENWKIFCKWSNKFTLSFLTHFSALRIWSLGIKYRCQVKLRSSTIRESMPSQTFQNILKPGVPDWLKMHLSCHTTFVTIHTQKLFTSPEFLISKLLKFYNLFGKYFLWPMVLWSDTFSTPEANTEGQIKFYFITKWNSAW